MPVNVEIKARARDWGGQWAKAKALTRHHALLIQEDTFFPVPDGRLKLREEKGLGAYLIYYRRPDRGGPKASRYWTAPVARPGPLKALMAAALGLGPVVKKRRRLLLAGRTRIHFDEVRGLGRFIELEVVLRAGEKTESGRAEAARLMAALGIAEQDLLSGAYAELGRPASRDGSARSRPRSAAPRSARPGPRAGRRSR